MQRREPRSREPPPKPVGTLLQANVLCTDSRGPVRVSQSPSSGPNPGAAPPDTTLVKTFIVEDSPIILDNLVATLEEMSPVQVVGSAGDEATALKRMKQLDGQLDLVIIDVFLKSGSGLGVLRSAAQAGLRARRVVLTNYATADMREKCRSLGAHRVFDKSNDLDDLISYCTHLADRPGDTSPGALG